MKKLVCEGKRGEEMEERGRREGKRGREGKEKEKKRAVLITNCVALLGAQKKEKEKEKEKEITEGGDQVTIDVKEVQESDIVNDEGATEEHLPGSFLFLFLFLFLFSLAFLSLLTFSYR
jgi:hypothetical protein